MRITFENILKKGKHIFLPFLLIDVSIIIGYTFLNWLLVIKTNLISLDEIVVEYWGVFVLSAIVVLIWILPKYKMLNQGKKGDVPIIFVFLAVIAISVPGILVQRYIATASQSLIELGSITQIDQAKQSRYYSLNKHYVDTTHFSAFTYFVEKGRHSEDLVMELYITAPILEKISDTGYSKCAAWLGVKYSDRISNDLSQEEKDSIYELFWKESVKNLQHGNLNQFVYLDRVGHNDDKEGYERAIKENHKYRSTDSPIFLGVDEPFENRSGNTLSWCIGMFVFLSLAYFAFLMIPGINQEGLKRLESKGSRKIPVPNLLLIMLKPTKSFFITPIIAYINVLMFLIMVFAGLGFQFFDAEDLLVWGANYRPLVLDGEWWRLLTSMFLHGGFMHLLGNMYGLLFIGFLLEPILGRKKLLIGYLLSGIIASGASLWWNEATASVGASGAIFGLFGLFLSLMLTHIIPPVVSKSFLLSIGVFIGINLLIGFATTGIDNAAHIGGIASGILIGFAYYPVLKKQKTMHQDLE